MTDLQKICENPPSLSPGKSILLSWTRGENTDLQKVCEKPPSLLSRNIFLLFFVQEKGLKMTDLTPLERERMTTVFRMTSLGINVRPLFISGLGLHRCISFVRPFDGEELWGIPWPIHTTGVPAESHATPSHKKRLGKGGGHGKVPTTCPRGEH